MLISVLFLPAPFSPAHDFLQAHKGEAEDPNPGQALVGFSERLGVILGKPQHNLRLGASKPIYRLIVISYDKQILMR